MNDMWQYNDLDELYHHGILGMRWGHRKARVSKSKKRTKRMSKDAYDAHKISKKKIHQLSNDELRRYNNRKNLENNYKKLNKKGIAKAAAIAAGVVAAAGAYNTLRSGGKHIISDGRSIVSNLKNFKIK